MLAYIDIFSVLFLLGVLSRATTILFIVKQAAGGALRLARNVLARVQRLDVRHRRTSGTAQRKRPASQASDEEGGATVVYGVAWA